MSGRGPAILFRRAPPTTSTMCDLFFIADGKYLVDGFRLFESL